MGIKIWGKEGSSEDREGETSEDDGKLLKTHMVELSGPQSFILHTEIAEIIRIVYFRSHNWSH